VLRLRRILRSSQELSGLTSLTFLTLNDNPDLSDIQPLNDNTGLGGGDEVDLSSTNVSCADVDAPIAKGVYLLSDSPKFCSACAHRPTLGC